MEDKQDETVELVFVHDPFSDLWAHLEYAACRVSDALMGNTGSRHGADAATILMSAARRDEDLTRSLRLMNDVLREIDRRRMPIKRGMKDTTARIAAAVEGHGRMTAQGMSAFGRDPSGREAKPASPVTK